MTIVIEDVTSNVTVTNGVVTGDGSFDVLMETVTKHLQAQYESGKIKGQEYANVYLGALQSTLAQATGFTVKVPEIEASTALTDAQEAEVLAGTIRKDAESQQQVEERTEKWDKQQNIVDNQVSMSTIDADNKQANVDLDLAQKDKVLDQLQADIDFNISKKTIMEDTRNDNIRIKSSELFAEFLKYMSAADAVPTTIDFKNMRGLIETIGLGIATPDETYTMLTPDKYRYVGGRYSINVAQIPTKYFSGDSADIGAGESVDTNGFILDSLGDKILIPYGVSIAAIDSLYNGDYTKISV